MYKLSFWYIRFRLREIKENIKWKIAWLIPRDIALLCFIRVCSASGDDPSNINFDSAYKNWELGAGK